MESLMNQDTPSPLPPDFMLRQRFKMLADLGRAEGKERAGSPGSYTQKAFQLAFSRDLSLVGVPDLLRMREITKGVVGDVAVDQEKVRIEPVSGATDGTANGVPIFLPATGTRQYIRIDRDVLIAREINQSLRVPDTTVQETLGVRIEGGKVTVPEGVNEARLKSLRDIGQRFNAMVVVIPR
jgi:hypothetical protein